MELHFWGFQVIKSMQDLRIYVFKQYLDYVVIATLRTTVKSLWFHCISNTIHIVIIVISVSTQVILLSGLSFPRPSLYQLSYSFTLWVTYTCDHTLSLVIIKYHTLPYSQFNRLPLQLHLWSFKLPSVSQFQQFVDVIGITVLYFYHIPNLTLLLILPPAVHYTSF